MSRPTIPAETRAVLEEILETLQGAELDALDQAKEKDCGAPYVAGYLGAVVKHATVRLEKLLEKDAPAEKAKAT